MIRAYTSKDKDQLLNLLRLNTAQYFDASEEADFIEYLANHLEDYFVEEENRQIIGSGGNNYFADSNLARISWHIVDPDFQGKGVGKRLTLDRIEHIRKNPAINLIVVRTTQLVYSCYEKMGFELEKTENDFWAKGFDLYQMKMILKR